MQNKICEVCGDVFTPKPQVGKRQRTCGKTECKRELHNRSQRKWMERNPDYYKGRYPYVKEWLKAHPDYQRNYRARIKENSHKNGEFDICRKAWLTCAYGTPQDELTICEDSVLNKLKQVIDIQDKLISRISTNKRNLDQLTALIYKTSYPIDNTASYVP